MSTVTLPDPFPVGIAPPWTVAGHADPIPWFVAMASERPLAFDDQTGIWHFSGYEQVLEFLRDWETWSTAKRLELVPPEHRVVRLLTTEPPTHVELREKFSRAYRPRRIAALEPQIRQVCRELLDTCLQKRRFDVTSEFAAPLTRTMIARLLGVPAGDEDRYSPSSQESQLGRLVDAAEGDDRPMLAMGGTPPEVHEAQQEYFRALIAKRRAEPQDDLISDLAQVPAEDFELRLDVGALLTEQLGAGQSTTTHLLGSLAYLLDRFPDQQALVRSRPDLAASAIEETVRYSSPLQARPRISTRAVQLGDVAIPEGATGLAWMQAANFDPRVFDDPTRYDITRSPNHHVAFGFGEHYCLGASLARMEARVALEELMAATRSLERVEHEPPRWVDDFILRGPARMEVEVQPA